MFDKGSFLTTIDAAATKLSTAETMRHFKPTARLNMNNFFVLVVFEFSRPAAELLYKRLERRGGRPGRRALRRPAKVRTTPAHAGKKPQKDGKWL